MNLASGLRPGLERNGGLIPTGTHPSLPSECVSHSSLMPFIRDTGIVEGKHSLFFFPRLLLRPRIDFYGALVSL